jgi:hypothetical protein
MRAGKGRMKYTPFQIDHHNQNWRLVLQRCLRTIEDAANSGSITVKIADVIRTLDQNSKMWPMLEDFAAQVPWPINGVLGLIEPEDWKSILTAAFEEEARLAPGMRGGFVLLGARTSRYTKPKMADFITFLYAEGNDRGVKWSEKAVEHYERYGAMRKAA